jgi:hypothetical protein
MKTILSVLSFAVSVSVASAQSFIANLNGAQDGGGLRTGSGVINLTLTGTTITFSGSFSGLSGTVNSGGFHIHAPAPPGQNASILYPLFPSITLNPDNKSGTISGSQTLIAGQLTFDIPTQINQLNSGLWYFNIHTSTFGGGEIRGQILAVPEPSTLVLAGLGVVGLLGLGIRRRWRS